MGPNSSALASDKASAVPLKMPLHPKPSKVDVLVVGAGPSGLMAATWLSRLGLKIRVIDKRGTRVLAGRGDGVHARTLEILDSFQLGDAVRATGYMLDDFVVWAPGADGSKHLVDRQTVWGTETSFVKPYTAHQGHIEAVFLDGLRKGSNPVEVERAVQPVDITIDSESSQKFDDGDVYPVTVTVKHLSEAEADVWPDNAHLRLPDGSFVAQTSTKVCPSVQDGAYQTEFQKSGLEGQTETIQAKFVIGSDGAHSWVRSKLGIKMLGSSSEDMWGVIDIVPKTDFPDIRRQGPIVATKHEPIVNVPRENGLSRFYVPLPADFAERNAVKALSDPSHAVCGTIMNRAREAFHPYTMDYEYCDWYTLYKVGRRIASAYSDPTRRVFLTGDACHTHTPKGGQGMNISIQDAYNLGWKIAGVLHGQLRPEVLATYESERRPIGQKLVELDQALSEGLGEAAEDRARLMDVYAQLRKMTDGRAVVYGSSIAVAKSATAQVAAPGIELGTRLHNHYVRAQATSWLEQTIRLHPSDGRWRLVVYGGDVSTQAQLDRVNALGAAISGPTGLVNRYPSTVRGKPWLEVLLLHSARLDAANVQAFHDVFRPRNEPHGGTSYFQIWADAPAPMQKTGLQAGEAHQTLGIDQTVGAMALVRPDTFTAWTGGYGDVEKLEEFCAGVLAGPVDERV